MTTGLSFDSAYASIAARLSSVISRGGSINTPRPDVSLNLKDFLYDQSAKRNERKGSD